jgi:hypothetical protein
MMYPRERYFEALEDFFKSTGFFKLVSRKVKMYTECAPSEFPALMIMSPTETYSLDEGIGTPPKTIIDVTCMVYLDGSVDIRETSVPMTTLNDLLDTFELMIKPNAHTMTLTLGGLVRHVWIEGEILKEPGDVDGEGIIVIPLKMLVP